MDLKKLLREGLLNENGKPFGKNTYKNRFEPTDDIKNKMHLLGVYRIQLGINNVNDIKTVDNVNSYYNEFIKKYSEELTKTDIPKKESTDDKDDKDYYNKLDLAREHVKLYADNFLKIYEFNNNKIQPITVKDYPKFENTFLNKFNFDENIKNKIKAQLNSDVISIENPDEVDVVFRDDNLIIVRGSSKSKCITYGQGQSWCISQSDANMYNTYRLNYKATMYFVLDKTKDETSDEEKLVIMVYPKKRYAIADKTNDGERAGSETDAKSWDEIVEELPILKGKEEYFESIDVSDSEIKYKEITEKEYEGDDKKFQTYINNSIKGLKVNGSEVTDREFIVDYITSVRYISPKQFESLDKRPKGPREGVIEAGYFISRKYDDYGLSETEIRRVVKLKIKNDYDITPKEFVSLDDTTRSELIDKGYFNPIGTSGYNLTDEEIKRVIKLKIKNGNTLSPKEFDSLDDTYRSEAIDKGYFNRRNSGRYNLTNEEFRKVAELKTKNGIKITSEEKFALLDNTSRREAIDKGHFNSIGTSGYNLTDEELIRVIKLKIKNGNYINGYLFNLLDTPSRIEAIDSGYFNGKNIQIHSKDFKLTDEEIIRITKLKLKNGDRVATEEFDLLDDSTRSEAIDNGYFTKLETSDYNLTDEELRRVLKIKAKNGTEMSPQEFDSLDKSTRIEAINNGLFMLWYVNYYDYNLTYEELRRIVYLRLKNNKHLNPKEFAILDDSTKSEVIDSGHFNKIDISKYELTDEELRRVEARKGEPVNESINLMKRMNLL